jgi:hypothetical protein
MPCAGLATLYSAAVGGELDGGLIMRVSSVLKVVLLAGAVALPASFSAAEAKGKPKLPPGACAFEKAGIPTNTICSFNSDPKTMWSQQQLCVNGVLTPMLPCYSGFCTAKCGG